MYNNLAREKSTGPQLLMTAQFDKALIWERGRSVRYLQIDIEAPDIRDRVHDPAPINIALAIDVSGSMSGVPLKSAKQAAIGLIEGMNARNILSVVAFSRFATVLLDGVDMSNHGKAAAIQAINKLEAGLDTNLSDGWLKAAECVAIASQRAPGYHNHIIVLSDGYANAGITAETALEKHSEQLRLRGIFTSAVGIGDEYSSMQLEALSVYGGGRLHDAQYMGEIVEVVLGELHELSTTLFDDINIILTTPSSVEVSNVSGFATQTSSRQTSTNIGSLGSGCSRSVILRLTLPSGKPGNFVSTNIDFSWKEPGRNDVVSGKGQQCQLAFAPESRNLTQLRDEVVSIQVARVWQAAVVKRAVALNRTGQLRELQRYLDNEIKYFCRYVFGLQSTEHLAAELVRLRDVSDREWNERSRKNMAITSHNFTQGHTDYRNLERSKDWHNYLPDTDKTD